MDRRHSAGTWSSEVIASTGQASMHELSLVPIHGSLITYTTPTTHAVAAVRPVDRSQGYRGHRGARRPASGCIAVACEYTSSASRPPGSSNADARPRCAPGRATLGRSARVRSPTGSDPHAYAELAGWLAGSRARSPPKPTAYARSRRPGAGSGDSWPSATPIFRSISACARSSPRWVSAPSALHRGPHGLLRAGKLPLPRRRASEPARRLHPTPRPHARSARHARTTGRSSRIRSPRS